MDYPKMLYKGAFLADAQKLKNALDSQIIVTVIVNNAEEDAKKAAEGFVPLSALIEANESVQRTEGTDADIAPKPSRSQRLRGFFMMLRQRIFRGRPDAA